MSDETREPPEITWAELERLERERDEARRERDDAYRAVAMWQREVSGRDSDIDQLTNKLDWATGRPCVDVCQANRAAGRGPCGACALCCKELRDEAEALRMMCLEREQTGAGLALAVAAVTRERDEARRAIIELNERCDSLWRDNERLKAERAR